jgi:hypothetical protein
MKALLGYIIDHNGEIELMIFNALSIDKIK